MFMTNNGSVAGHRRRGKEEGSWNGYNAEMRGAEGYEYESGTACRSSFPGHRAKSKVGAM